MGLLGRPGAGTENTHMGGAVRRSHLANLQRGLAGEKVGDCHTLSVLLLLYSKGR